MTEQIERTAIEDWAAIESLFTLRHSFAPLKFATLGMSSRLAKGRLGKLLAHKSAGSLAALVDQMEDDRVKAMRTFAAINLEQAASAFKITLVANVTAPLLVVTFFNQITPGGVGDQLYDIFGGEGNGIYGLFAGIAVGIAMLFGLGFYALANLNQARDIRNLIDLFAAERGIYFGLEDIDDMSA